MIEQRLDPAQEIDRVRHAAMRRERRLVAPTGGEVEERRIGRRPKRADREAAGFAAGRADDLAQGGGQFFGRAVAGLESGEDDQLHLVSPPRRPALDYARTGLRAKKSLNPSRG